MATELDTVRFTVELTDEQATQFAQFLKRAMLIDYRAKSRSDEEAYTMRDAALKVAEALSQAGFEPR